MDKIKVLFVCVHNSGRSQIAEAFLKKFGGAHFEVVSAGLTPTAINPLAIEVMKESGIDISKNESKGVFELYKQNKLFHYVISVCDEARQKCPKFPGLLTKYLVWSFEDLEALEGTHEDKLEKARKIRDDIKTAVENFVRHANN